MLYTFYRKDGTKINLPEVSAYEDINGKLITIVRKSDNLGVLFDTCSCKTLSNSRMKYKRRLLHHKTGCK